MMKRQGWQLLFVVLFGLMFFVGSIQAQEGDSVEAPQAAQEAVSPLAALALVDTSFTYQGSLLEKGRPVNDTCDFTFTLWDAETGGTQIGNANSFTDVAVEDGLFTVTLDFGQDVFTGEARWLEIQVACAGAAETLSPRQPLRPAPYALALPGLYTREHADSPNVIGGHRDNRIVLDAAGAVISGGGSSGANNVVFDEYGVIGGGGNNRAGNDDGDPTSAPYATVGGGYSNTATASYTTVGGGYAITASGLYATVGGGRNNTASADHATVSGGGDNSANTLYATVGGGQNNIASGYAATVGGGYTNQVNADYAFVGGGDGNEASGKRATVSGGWGNIASGSTSTIGGGSRNTASNDLTTVGGGYLNTASGSYATVGGGRNNEARAEYATIAGGGPSDPDVQNTNNIVYDDYGVIGGGGHNRAGNDDGDPTSAAYAAVVGGYSNIASASHSTVGGGGSNTASGDYATVGGGMLNSARGLASTVSGGDSNSARDDYSTVGGGAYNTANAPYATVGGGRFNEARAEYATIAGGGPSDPSNPSSDNNVVYDRYGTIGGGGKNRAGSDDDDPTNAEYATVSGGVGNTASGSYSTVGGGYGNTASGNNATVPGGYANIAQGAYSFAAGLGAQALNDGCFVWADSYNHTLTCEDNDRTLFRSSGGFYIYTSILNTGAYLAANGSSWNSLSSREAKENFQPVDVDALLARLAEIEILTWNYKNQDPAIRHIGPMAEDFNQLIEGLGGEGEAYINSLDADGVALAAIQGLYRQNQALQAENEALRARVDALETQLDELLARLAALEAAGGGP